MSRRLRRAGAALIGLALVATACGGDDGAGETGSGNLIDKGAEEAVKAGASASTAAPKADPTTMEGWEALWKSEREAIVARIKQNKWGLQPDGKTVLGPDGFTFDLSKCPAGWNPTEGLTDTEIKLGSAAPASGTQATGVYINQAMSVIFDYYADKGLFTDSLGKKRRVNQIIKDDGYDPARTIPIVDELIDSDKVFDVMTQGSPSTLKTYDKLNQRCIPQSFNSTGHPAWGDPVNHPWTNGMLLAYNIEALLWGDFIEQRLSEFPNGVKVAALVMNNDFGKVYDQAFKAYLAQSPNKDKIEYVTEFIEPQAANVTDPMTTLASKDPDVFIEMLTGTPCAQAITESAQNGMNEETPYRFVSSVCKSATFVGKAAVGEASEGWWVVGGGIRDLASPGEDGNAYVQWARQLLTSKGYDYKISSFYGAGLSFGWSRAQVYMVAGALDGGLNRINYLTALRAMDSMTPAAYFTGIKANLSGNRDAYWIEGSELAKYDAASQQFVQQGDIIELSGKSKTCAWDQATSICR